jgi:hypothetical protein
LSRTEAGFWVDVGRVLAVLPSVERWRRFAGTQAGVDHARALGRLAPVRDKARRARLRGAIRLVDRLCGASCHRRVLLTTALDPTAARTPIHIGLDASGRPSSGHMWLATERVNDRYALTLEL